MSWLDFFLCFVVVAVPFGVGVFAFGAGCFLVSPVTFISATSTTKGSYGFVAHFSTHISVRMFALQRSHETCVWSVGCIPR